MSDVNAVVKDASAQIPVPVIWQRTIRAIVDAIVGGDFKLEHGISRVSRVAPEIASQMADCVNDYGVQLAALPDLTWETSACQWMRGYWDVLIDLFAADGDPTDLVLALRVFEAGDDYDFVVQSIHVP